jgi:hypothetical protein
VKVRSLPDASKRIKEPLCLQQESAEAVPIIARSAVEARRYFIFRTPLFVWFWVVAQRHEAPISTASALGSVVHFFVALACIPNLFFSAKQLISGATLARLSAQQR